MATGTQKKKKKKTTETLNQSLKKMEMQKMAAAEMGEGGKGRGGETNHDYVRTGFNDSANMSH